MPKKMPVVKCWKNDFFNNFCHGLVVFNKLEIIIIIYYAYFLCMNICNLLLFCLTILTIKIRHPTHYIIA